MIKIVLNGDLVRLQYNISILMGWLNVGGPYSGEQVYSHQIKIRKYFKAYVDTRTQAYV